MPKLILFNKPYGVLTHFTDTRDRGTLADYIPIPNIYPAGRLDKDSEGLLLLTDDGRLQHRIRDPHHKVVKIYWVQVEGTPDESALSRLRHGVVIQGRKTRPAQARILAPPRVWERKPPIRVRKYIPTCWLGLEITEGRNRQVRRMTAAIGHPTLRLIRYAIGSWTLAGLAPGQWREVAL